MCLYGFDSPVGYRVGFREGGREGKREGGREGGREREREGGRERGRGEGKREGEGGRGIRQCRGVEGETDSKISPELYIIVDTLNKHTIRSTA